MGIVGGYHIPYLQAKCLPFCVFISHVLVKLWLCQYWTAYFGSLVLLSLVQLHHCLNCSSGCFHYCLCDCIIHSCLLCHACFLLCLIIYLLLLWSGLVCFLWDSFSLLTPCNVLLCLIWWQMPLVLVYVSLFLVLAIVCASNKCMWLYTYASAIWCYMAIGQQRVLRFWQVP